MKAEVKITPDHLVEAVTKWRERRGHTVHDVKIGARMECQGHGPGEHMAPVAHVKATVEV